MKRSDPLETLEESLEKTLNDHPSLSKVRRWSVALSGGRDSIALLVAMTRLGVGRGWEVSAHHIRHGLRSGDRLDADLCAEVCVGLKVPLVVTRFEVGALKGGEEGTQSSARVARYGALCEAARVAGEVLVTAHHADDALETSWMRWIRGAGLEGLAGIPFETQRDGVRIVRPLLEVSRDQINRYVQRRGLRFCEDPSNATDDYLRNRVRHHLMPLLERLGAGKNARQQMYRSLRNLRHDAEALSVFANASAQEMGTLTSEPAWYAPLSRLQDIGDSAAAQVIRHAARLVVPGHTPEAIAIEKALATLHDPRRRPWRSSKLSLGREGRFFVLRDLDAAPPQGLGEEEIEVFHGQKKLNILELEFTHAVNHYRSQRYLCVASAEFDLMAIRGRLYFRSWDPSKESPSVRRKIREAFRLRGTPALWRDAHPVLRDEEGILWVPGVWRAPRAKSKGRSALKLAMSANPWYIQPIVKHRPPDVASNAPHLRDLSDPLVAAFAHDAHESD